MDGNLRQKTENKIPLFWDNSNEIYIFKHLIALITLNDLSINNFFYKGFFNNLVISLFYDNKSTLIF